MATIYYPHALPCPQTSTVTPAERRALSNADRPREARNIQRDRLEYERLTWPPLNATKAEAILTFWRDTLQRGGAWFLANWPLPRGDVPAMRKFREQPKWQFIPGGFWQLSALCEVRGRGDFIICGVPRTVILWDLLPGGPWASAQEACAHWAASVNSGEDTWTGVLTMVDATTANCTRFRQDGFEGPTVQFDSREETITTPCP